MKFMFFSIKNYSDILLKNINFIYSFRYNAFNVYRRELAPGTVSLTGDRAQGDDSKHWAYSNQKIVF